MLSGNRDTIWSRDLNRMTYSIVLQKALDLISIDFVLPVEHNVSNSTEVLR